MSYAALSKFKPTVKNSFEKRSGKMARRLVNWLDHLLQKWEKHLQNMREDDQYRLF